MATACTTWCLAYTMAARWAWRRTCSRLGGCALLAEGPFSSLQLAVGALEAMTRRLQAPIGSAKLPAQHARVAVSPCASGQHQAPHFASPLQRGDGVVRVMERRLAACMVLDMALAASTGSISMVTLPIPGIHA